MTKGFFRRSMVAVLIAAGGVACFAAFTAPAVAQQDGTRRASASDGTFHLWWNSENYIIRAKLGSVVRGQMDAVWAAHGTSIEQIKPDEHQQGYDAAVLAGDWKRAQQELSAWANAERAQVKAQGDLQVAILSLLSQEQLAAVLSAGRRSFLRQPWRAKMNWPIRGAK